MSGWRDEIAEIRKLERENEIKREKRKKKSITS